jgi:malate dehydrogenase
MVGRRVGIVGAGMVGATAAYSLVMTGICHRVILYDIAPDVARGKAIDIGQSTCYSPKGTVVEAAEDISGLKNCDIVVITAGVPRRSDMTRADLLMINAGIMKDIIAGIKKHSPDAIILCVSNPLDVMTYVIQKLTGWDRSRIIGMAGALDGARMAYQIQQKVGYGSGQTRAMILGEHGQHMIPYPEISAVGGVPLNQLVNAKEMENIIARTKEGGAEIVKYLGTSAYFAPGRSVSIMVEAILDDSRIVMPSSVVLEGEYGYSEVSVGVPIVLGARGIHEIIELNLDERMKSLFKESVKAIKENIEVLHIKGFFD